MFTKRNFNDNEDGIVEGMLYAIITVATALVMIIALGPLMHIIISDLYGNLLQEDTVFANSLSGFNSFMSMINQSEQVWEMSFIFFCFIAIIYMIARAIRKQSYTQYDRV